MRASALFVWMFINLLFFGMCGYLYLIWSRYWMKIEKQRYQQPTEDLGDGYVRRKHTESRPNGSMLGKLMKHRRSVAGALWSNARIDGKDRVTEFHTSADVVVNIHGKPRFPNVHKPVLEFDTEDYKCIDYKTPECDKKSTEYKNLLLKEFHRVMLGDSNVFKTGLDVHNVYNVKYVSKNLKNNVSREDLLCLLKRVNVRTITAEDEPFKSLSYKIPSYSPSLKQHYKSCAVVTSAGALLGSGLGEFIDSHDMVLRFNNAPVVNYTNDVGSKTTFRILNSQVVAKAEYNFINDPMYRNVSIIIWDPSNYSSTLLDWYQNPDFPFFSTYKQVLDSGSNADVHILNPSVLWDLWSVLKDATPYRLRRNPPSSGFLGLWFSLNLCDEVRVFEYLPSVRISRRCHYYRSHEDPGCTLGSWHPLAQEKSFAERIRDNSDKEAFQSGFIHVKGFRQISCP